MRDELIRKLDARQTGPTSFHSSRGPNAQPTLTIVRRGSKSTATLVARTEAESRIAYMWAEDQHGEIVFMQEFKEGSDDESTPFVIPEDASSLKGYLYRPRTGLFAGPATPVRRPTRCRSPKVCRM